MTLISTGKVGVRGVLGLSGLGAVLLLGACREEDSEAGAQSSGDAPAVTQDLAAGESRLEMSGLVETTGSRETLVGDTRYGGDAADIFCPSASRNRRGSNADGPYELVLYADAIHTQRDPDTPVRAALWLTLPAGAAPGTYAISGRRAADDEAIARLAGDGYAWDYTNGFSGQLLITAIEDTLTASFDITLQSQDDQIGILGGVNALPLTTQAEVRYELTGPDETREEFARPSGRPVGSDGDYQLMLGPDLYLRLPAGFGTGRYALVQRSAGPDEAGMRLMDYDYDDLVGEIALERLGDQLSGAFAFSTEGTAPVEVRGRFDGVTLQE